MKCNKKTITFFCFVYFIIKNQKQQQQKKIDELAISYSLFYNCKKTKRRRRKSN